MPLGKPQQTQTDNTKKENEKSIDFELTDPKYDFQDIIVNQETAKEIMSIISLKRDYELVFSEMDFSSTHKNKKKFIINFYGEPGTGKTITAHAFAKAFNKKILLVDYSQVESKYVGETPKNLKRIFDFANQNDCVIFFDEADAILSRRVTNMQNSTDTSVNQTRSVMLNILNDFEGDLIFATNFISNYDPAFMRRISKHVLFRLPDSTNRLALFRKYIPPKQQENINFDVLVSASSGLSAADIENITLMAGFAAASEKRKILTMVDILRQTELVQDSKKQNSGIKDNKDLSQRFVSEDYVKQQLGEK